MSQLVGEEKIYFNSYISTDWSSLNHTDILVKTDDFKCLTRVSDSACFVVDGKEHCADTKFSFVVTDRGYSLALCDCQLVRGSSGVDLCNEYLPGAIDSTLKRLSHELITTR